MIDRIYDVVGIVGRVNRLFAKHLFEQWPISSHGWLVQSHRMIIAALHREMVDIELRQDCVATLYIFPATT